MNPKFPDPALNTSPSLLEGSAINVESCPLQGVHGEPRVALNSHLLRQEVCGPQGWPRGDHFAVGGRAPGTAGTALGPCRPSWMVFPELWNHSPQGPVMPTSTQHCSKRVLVRGESTRAHGGAVGAPGRSAFLVPIPGVFLRTPLSSMSSFPSFPGGLEWPGSVPSQLLPYDLRPGLFLCFLQMLCVSLRHRRSRVCMSPLLPKWSVLWHV